MRTRDINPGRDYLITVRIPAVRRIPATGQFRGSPGFPGCRVARRVTAIEITPAGIVIEASHWVGRLDGIPPGGQAWAMINGQIAWQLIRTRWTVSSRQISRPAPAAPERSTPNRGRSHTPRRTPHRPADTIDVLEATGTLTEVGS